MHEAPVLIVSEHLVQSETMIVTDEKNFDNSQYEIQLSALCDEQTGLYTQTCHQSDNHQVFERCSTEVHGVELNHDDTSLCKAAVPQSRTVRVVQVAHIAILYLPESCVDHTVQMSVMLLYYCASTLVSKIFYCVSLCLLYVMYCSIVLRYCTYLNPCSV